MKKLILKWEWLVVILCAVVLLRVPSLLEPYWYGDEGIYLVIGQAINRGEELYKGIHDNKPPFLYLVAAGAGGSQFWFKFWAMSWNLATIVVFAFLAKKVLGKEKQKAVWLATGSMALFSTIPLFEGNIANAELFFLLFTVGAAALLYDKDRPAKSIFLGGLLLGLGGLFKIPAVVEAGVWPILWWGERERGWWKKCLTLGAGVALPLVLSGLYYTSRGVLKEYLVAAAGQNVGYLSSWGGGEAGGIHTLAGRAVAAAIVAGGILWLARSKRIDRAGAMAGLWGTTAVFGALLSGRPYPHYLMQAVGAGALAVGLIAGSKRATRMVGVGVITMMAAAFVTFKFYGYRIGGYYINFGKWILGRQSQSEYYDWFNANVGTNYEIAGIVMGGSDKDDRVFVWGDEPMIYALAKRRPAGKYAVRYHILDFGAQQQTMETLIKDPPKYIVSFGREEDLPGLSDLIGTGYRLEKTVGSAKIYRVTGMSWWRY